ncbi:MAG: hypothetical protein IRY89_03595 [Pseudolabrys sp.]|nr:hypothetical protein [Pseudolabrys sp.]
MAHARTIPAASALAVGKSSSAKPSIWTRLLNAIAEANMRRAEREIAIYLQNGGKFTDETEREIERRFLNRR